MDWLGVSNTEFGKAVAVYLDNTPNKGGTALNDELLPNPNDDANDDDEVDADNNEYLNFLLADEADKFDARVRDDA